ncbi:hypothetical protein [Mesorhizobium sp. B2-4-5]|uniref:hypothetical protein n=1 Tax=Mesorhizobium sp. B2-4-5 TaxID=2589944 RepID=UPI00112CAE71|nr:hypothetical protein [Mesorhizobium sp. B2-4-5]TPL42646.1 hypothetical protein FJ961_08120 [Mesorhizobium sp. B2-4-5]
MKKIEHLNWYINAYGYAVAGKKASGVKEVFFMHRLVLSDPPELVDHKDHEKLNNRKTNLRPTDKSVNGFNHSRKFTGVWWDARRSKWQAYLGSSKGKPGRRVLGRYASRRDAQQAVVTELYKIDPIAAKHREELMNAENN